jgi:hypothetical protein
VTALERAAQLRVLQAPAQDRANHLVSIFHFETVMLWKAPSFTRRSRRIFAMAYRTR